MHKPASDKMEESLKFCNFALHSAPPSFFNQRISLVLRLNSDGSEHILYCKPTNTVTTCEQADILMCVVLPIGKWYGGSHPAFLVFILKKNKQTKFPDSSELANESVIMMKMGVIFHHCHSFQNAAGCHQNNHRRRCEARIQPGRIKPQTMHTVAVRTCSRVDAG